jgi:hypothetical protein
MENLLAFRRMHVPKRFGELDAHETAGDLILQTTTLKVSDRVIVMLASLVRTGADIPSVRGGGQLFSGVSRSFARPASIASISSLIR